MHNLIRCPLACATVLLLALLCVLALTISTGSFYADRAGLLWRYALAWALYAAGVWALRKVPGRQAAFLVIAGGIAVTATGLLAPPATSTDAYRYAWDGRVQAAGVSPYDHAPADPALTPLRDRWLFPEGADCDGPDRYPVPSRDGARSCTRINRPAVHTIYPPLAEAYFAVVHRLSPEGSRHKPLQIGGALLALGTSLVLLIALSPKAPARAAWWAWCPAVPIEAVNNAHVDAFGVLLTVIALITASRHRVRGGLLLGAATAVKLLPAAAAPGMLSGLLAKGGPSGWRRAPAALAVLGPALLVVALAYLPYVLASRDSVFGYFFGYLNEEGYSDAGADSRYAVLRLILPDSWALPAALAVFAAAALFVLRRGDAHRPWRGALVVTGTAFLVFTPGYSWYALLVVALAALDGRWEWLGIPPAGSVAYLSAQAGLGTAAYGVAALAVITGLVARVRFSAHGAARRTAAPRRRREPK
ncbi:glycosyltransferase 87 family protein [Nonomuraea jabiensis]|uniref:MFS family permease n=1 Tax=Nonomuraea jabiensis TaxID=882448 RepID=A0A7W9G241_9ACTN|nr:glycosyltransferase 87 family protein [Nonomuraea jabiensis]MBB5775756.1 MFS family permease [Nonomuraea jabiensis]